MVFINVYFVGTEKYRPKYKSVVLGRYCRKWQLINYVAFKFYLYQLMHLFLSYTKIT